MEEKHKTETEDLTNLSHAEVFFADWLSYNNKFISKNLCICVDFP